jgi:aminoglycoside phosphotransferase family enzyme
MFAKKNNSNVDFCFKMWQECDNALYDTKDLRACAKYLLEGLKFNKLFARDVYFGIAPVRRVDKDRISCGKLIWFPFFLSNWRIGRSRQEYVLVMRRLEQSWRLDHQLLTDDMKTKGAMDLLAKEIARMHSRLEPSHEASGNAASILNKLKLNETEFNAALDELCAQKWPAPFDKNKYMFINSIMQGAYKKCAYHFTQRYESGYVRRCHGDLKATNLWIYPGKNGQRELLALDCVDFKADFCHIDILSDVAMLAIDLEMRLTRWSDNYEDKKNGRKLTNHFLYTYLKEAMAKGDPTWLLLEYYMTEKAMICAFMSIRYDQLPTLGEKYLDVAFAHAQRLQRRLKLLPSKSRQLVYSR